MKNYARTKQVKKVNLRRGFKTESNQHSRNLRKELGLVPHAPLCPFALAKHLEIPIVALSELKETIPDEVAILTDKEPDSFSAVTIFHGTRRLIIHNNAHHPRRQASNIAHELSHAILAHPPSPPFNDYGLRNYDSEYENEANWLGPALLISEEAALYIAKNKMTLDQALEHYKVTQQVIQMRLNVTGALKRIKRVKV
jgi:Zn-dependent peptidase ImmA (M78 family)